MAHDSYGCTLLDFMGNPCLGTAADSALRMKIQKISDFLDELGSTGKTDEPFSSRFESVIVS